MARGVVADFLHFSSMAFKNNIVFFKDIISIRKISTVFLLI